tara:strand:- start:1136 stop:1270 length:135 start_codon:yes stop_codon:yes gene_type:complete
MKLFRSTESRINIIDKAETLIIGSLAIGAVLGFSLGLFVVTYFR